jgi:FixJ family two-component response regulator
MAFHPPTSAKQYEGAMDISHGMRHCLVVDTLDAPKNGSEDRDRLLSVVVDDDESVRESLPDLLREFGFASRAFSSAKEFLSSGCLDEAGCLILDVAMPGMSGPELQQELKRRGKDIPIIFITGRRDDTIRAQVLKQGAAGFLLKPFSEMDLLAAIKAAIQGTSGSTLDL